MHTMKINKIKIFIVVIVLFLTSLLASCEKKNTDSTQDEVNEDLKQIYYINSNETKIVGEIYEPESTKKEDLVKEYLKKLGSQPENFALKQAKPDRVIVEKFNFNEDDRLSLYFNTDYKSMTGITEVLCRAAIVKTLSQIEGVDSIEFYINGQPLMGNNDKPIGIMYAKDFIDNTSAEDVYVTVYFSNKKGNALLESNLKITYDGNFSIEQIIIDRLIAGPIEDNMIKTIPEGTKLIEVTTKDGICYVDFNDKFLDKMPGVKDEVVIYSVVNSLVELTTINKVQFTIDGSTKQYYREDLTFDNLFERNLELMEGSK